MTKTQPEERRFFTTTQVARYCEVSNDGVLKWIKGRKLKAFATPGGHYRISAEDFREFLTLYAFPVQESFFGTPSEVAQLTRILVVEDETDQRKLLLRLLREIDSTWLLDDAADGYEAGIKIGMMRPDLVVLDLMMPRVDGIALCRSIRSNPATQSVRILILTGDADEQARERALAAGADQCVVKPISLPRLRHEVSRLLRRPVPRRIQPEQRI